MVVNSDMSTVIFGASSIKQVESNVDALNLAARWTQEIEDKMNTIFVNTPEAEMDLRKFKPMTHRRQVALDLNFGDKLVDVHFPQSQ